MWDYILRGVYTGKSMSPYIDVTLHHSILAWQPSTSTGSITAPRAPDAGVLPVNRLIANLECDFSSLPKIVWNRSLQAYMFWLHFIESRMQYHLQYCIPELPGYESLVLEIIEDNLKTGRYPGVDTCTSIPLFWVYVNVTSNHAPVSTPGIKSQLVLIWEEFFANEKPFHVLWRTNSPV